jgi:hypothetical protein
MFKLLAGNKRAAHLLGGSVIDCVCVAVLLVSDRDHPNGKWVLNENPDKDDNNDQAEEIRNHL